MESILEAAIQTAQESDLVFTKFITANDTGKTGGHQAGFHIHQNAWQLFFDKPGVKGENKDKYVTIKWQNYFETHSRFIYYGVGTRNEYRLTRFQKRFPYLTDENVGDLLVVCKRGENYYHAYVLQTDEEIEDFFAAFNISSTETNKLIPKKGAQKAEDKLIKCFLSYLKSLSIDFPATSDLALNARNCYNRAHSVTANNIVENPDKELLNWLDAEYQLFRIIENDRYSTLIKKPFTNVEELVETANTILNRRKSRAGKSLEHHLSEVFNTFYIAFATQAVTEDNKKPDFIFPNREAYHNPKFDEKKLIFLASKTTCKDRWRQVLNEADRIKIKHLFTLQQGISKNQLEEMYKYNIRLVVPKPYIKKFPIEFRNKILTLETFINNVRNMQNF